MQMASADGGWDGSSRGSENACRHELARCAREVCSPMKHTGAMRDGTTSPPRSMPSRPGEHDREQWAHDLVEFHSNQHAEAVEATGWRSSRSIIRANICSTASASQWRRTSFTPAETTPWSLASSSHLAAAMRSSARSFYHAGERRAITTSRPGDRSKWIAAGPTRPLSLCGHYRYEVSVTTPPCSETGRSAADHGAYRSRGGRH
jgi:hypothetical protein